jgi:hypothetical protein
VDENYWEQQQHHGGKRLIRLAGRDENYWTQPEHRVGRRFIRLSDRDDNYWTRSYSAKTVRPAAGLRGHSSYYQARATT